MNNEHKDAEFIKNGIKENIALPESLSAENIARLVSGEKQKKSKKGVVRRFVAASVAACVVITSAVTLSLAGLDKPESIQMENSQTEDENAFTADSYDEIIGKIKRYAKKYERANNRVYLYSFFSDAKDVVMSVDDDMVVVQEASDSSVNAPSKEEAASEGDYGKVNLRHEGVREGDILITDGEYLYGTTGYGKNICIIKAEKDGRLTKIAEISSDADYEYENGSHLYYSGLYRYESYLIAGFSEYESKDYTATNNRAGVIIYDISNPSQPVEVKKFALDGSYISSRIIDGRLILITSHSIVKYFGGDDEELFIPYSYNDGEKEAVPCDCICYLPQTAPEAYVNIANIDLSAPDKEMVVSSFLGQVADTYCTRDSLYIVGYEYSYAVATDDSVINTFFGGGIIGINSGKTKISLVDISDGKAEYVCSQEFEGSLTDSYAIDKFNDFVRVAVHRGDENCILVFDSALQKVGELTGIAPGESIKSVRFMGNTAYVVTFLQTDPLFVIDLSNPQAPEIKGELKIPGFSAYLHPVGENLLVGVGYGGTENGTDGSSKVSLFDVSDPASPKETDSISFPHSQLGTEPKAYCSVDEGSFLLTYTNWDRAYEVIETDGYYSYYITSGALYISCENNSLVLKNAYLTKSVDTVSRATFIDDRVYIYNEGDSGFASFDMESGELLDSLSPKENAGFMHPGMDKYTVLFSTDY